MNMTVWKFMVPPPDRHGRTFIMVPSVCTLLSVGIQDEDGMVVWGLVDATYPALVKRRKLTVANTGMEVMLGEHARFLGTVNDEGMIWHVWEDG